MVSEMGVVTTQEGGITQSSPQKHLSESQFDTVESRMREAAYQPVYNGVNLVNISPVSHPGISELCSSRVEMSEKVILL